MTSALLLIAAVVALVLSLRLGSARALVLALGLLVGAWLADSAPTLHTPFDRTSAALETANQGAGR